MDEQTNTLPQYLLDLLSSAWNGPEFPVPQRVSSDRQSRFYRYDCTRIGVIINDQERRDCTFYDVAAGIARFTNATPDITCAFIQPFWRYPESRQQRRARQRWESKR